MVNPRTYTDVMSHDRGQAYAPVAEHILGMAGSLNLQTIAEGVETAGQASWLLAQGVQYCQGRCFAKAMPTQQFFAWFTQRKSDPLPLACPTC